MRKKKTEDVSTWNNKEWLEQKYTVENLSTQRIAALLDTFPNTVRRALKRHGIALRDKKEAQVNFLEEHDHPMLGRERTEEEKKKISQGIQTAWDAMTDEEKIALKEKMSETAKMKWEWMSEEDRDANILKMHKANREKSGEGSKNENMVAAMLVEAGFKIDQRTYDYSPQNRYEIDIAIPAHNIAIEWDGAAHFEAIYGEDSLKRTMAKDEKKNGALIGQGWTLIRARDHSTSHSVAFCQRAVNKIIAAIEEYKKKPAQVVHLDME